TRPRCRPCPRHPRRAPDLHQGIPDVDQGGQPDRGATRGPLALADFRGDCPAPAGGDRRPAPFPEALLRGMGDSLPPAPPRRPPALRRRAPDVPRSAPTRRVHAARNGTPPRARPPHRQSWPSSLRLHPLETPVPRLKRPPCRLALEGAARVAEAALAGMLTSWQQPFVNPCEVW